MVAQSLGLGGGNDLALAHECRHWLVHEEVVELVFALPPEGPLLVPMQAEVAVVEAPIDDGGEELPVGLPLVDDVEATGRVDVSADDEPVPLRSLFQCVEEDPEVLLVCLAAVRVGGASR